MLCEANIWFIDDFDTQENYAASFSSFEDTIKERDCVSIDDDILDD